LAFSGFSREDISPFCGALPQPGKLETALAKGFSEPVYIIEFIGKSLKPALIQQRAIFRCPSDQYTLFER